MFGDTQELEPISSWETWHSHNSPLPGDVDPPVRPVETTDDITATAE